MLSISPYLILTYLFLSILFKIYFLLPFLTVTSKDVCRNIHNVKLDDVNLLVFQECVLLNCLVYHRSLCVIFCSGTMAKEKENLRYCFY